MAPRKTERAWRDFAEWCRDRRLRALPAHPWTVAAYARWCETRHRFPIVLERIRVIARVHLLECAPAPDRHPTVTRTLRMLEARSRTRAGRAALFPAEDVTPGATKRPKNADRHPESAGGRSRRQNVAMRSSPNLVRRPPRSRRRGGKNSPVDPAPPS